MSVRLLPPTLTLPLKGGGDVAYLPPPPLRGREGRGDR
jgi:hypothetical protein